MAIESFKNGYRVWTNKLWRSKDDHFLKIQVIRFWQIGPFVFVSLSRELHIHFSSFCLCVLCKDVAPHKLDLSILKI